MRNDLFDDTINFIYIRTNLSPGNINPQSSHLASDAYFNSLFYTDRPNHLIACAPEDSQFLVDSILKARGVRAINYNTFYSDLELDSNQRANQAAYFLGSVDQPYTPYILVTSTKNVVAWSYFRRFGLTAFSYKEWNRGLCDYSLTHDLLNEVITRPVYLTDQFSDLFIDLHVGPTYDINLYTTYLESLVPRLSQKLHTDVTLHRFPPALYRNGLGKDDQPYSPIEGFYTLTTFEVLEMLLDRAKVELPRKFIVAPSGSGKSYWVRMHSSYCVDADTMLSFPSGRWWEDESLADSTNNANQLIVQKWLSGPKDGKIIFYADPLGIKPDAFVTIQADIHKRQLSINRKNQPGLSDFDRISNSHSKYKGVYASVPVFTTFKDAVSHVLGNGRLRLPLRNRFNYMFYFKVKKIALGWEIQTYNTSQTWIVKSITYAVSRLLNFGDADMEVFRRRALDLNGGYSVPRDNEKGFRNISGFIKYRGRITALTISGHMVNYVILSCFIPLDWVRLLDQIEWNAELHETRRKLTHEERTSAEKYLLAEFNDLKSIYKLWHNIPEWYIGLDAGIMFARYLGLEPRVELIKLIQSEIAKIGKRYPKAYKEAMVISDQRKKGFINKDFIPHEETVHMKEWLPS